jgi:thiamine biosynthesis protein ThiS
VKLLINGEQREITSATTVNELVRLLDLPAQALLVEHNGLALHQNEWPERKLCEGDRLEIVRVVAGG